MKKFIYGITAIILGVLGVLTCMIVSAIVVGTHGYINIWDALHSFGLLPFFMFFILVAAVGKCLCVTEMYCNKKL